MAVLDRKLSLLELCALVLSRLLRECEAGYPLVRGYTTPSTFYETPATIMYRWSDFPIFNTSYCLYIYSIKLIFATSGNTLMSMHRTTNVHVFILFYVFVCCVVDFCCRFFSYVLMPSPPPPPSRLAFLRFTPKLGETVPFRRWLRVEPPFALLTPGERAEFTVSVFVDRLTARVGAVVTLEEWRLCPV